MEQKGTVTLTGTVKSIVFQNEENGYTICRTDCMGDEITMVGTLPQLTPGEQIEAEGDYITHPTFGRQFSVQSAAITIPATENAILTYLSSRCIKGVGERTAKRMVDAFGAQTLNVIENEPERLCIIKGISQNRAQEIRHDFLARRNLRDIIAYLSQFGIAGVLAIRAYRELGEDAMEQIRQNPYILCIEMIGIDFDTADKIAQVQGIDFCNDKRRKAGVAHVLTHNLKNGHTYIPRDALVLAASGLLQEDTEIIDNCLDEMLEQDELIYYKDGGDESIYLSNMFFAEKFIAQKLFHLASNTMPAKNIDEEITELEREFDIEYAPLQRRAIARAAKGGVMVITGGPGTGKTTIIRGIIRLMELQGKKTALAAPTGRAAKRMGELCAVEAKTLHRMLEMEYNPYDSNPRFARNEKRPIKAEVVIVDECSMVDVRLMEALLRALKSKASLILVGDIDQLPSIGAGNVLSDIIGCDCVDTIALDEIFRQAMDSYIVVNAHRINNGEYPDLTQRRSDFFFLKQKEPEALGYLLVSLCRDRLPKAYNISGISDVQIITPSKRTLAGTVCLNKLLQEALNPSSMDKEQIKINDTLFRVGDKVMQIRNNYDMECICDSGEIVSGVFNGDVGQIIEVDIKGRTLIVRFDDRIAEYEGEQLMELELAYAITVHKSQGSEFPIVIIPTASKMPLSLLNRNLLYTAVTRATKMVILAGDEGVIYKMVDNNRRTRRYSGLLSMLYNLFMGQE